MSWRKSGALRWGFVAAAAIAASNQTLSVQSAVIAVSAPDAIVVSAGSPVAAIPYQRPIAQRGIRTWGLSNPVPFGSGPQTLVAGSNTIAISAPTATLSTGTVSVPVPFRRPFHKRAVHRWGPVAPSVQPETVFPQTIQAGANTIALSAPTATLTSPGVQTSIVALKWRFVRQTRPTQPQPQAFTWGAVTFSQGQVLAAGQQTLAISAPTATRTVTGRTLTAGANTIALSAPTASVSLATVRTAGAQTIAISAPSATLTVSAVTKAAGAQTIALSAPAAVRLAGITCQAGANSIALSAPVAIRVIGATLVQAGMQTIAISAPDPRVLGASTLPDFVASFLESRQDERTVAARGTVNTLESRQSTNDLGVVG